MTLRRRSLLTVFHMALVAGLASLPLAAQPSAPSSPPVQTVSAASPQTAPHDPYRLPPDKLAKALALSHIRLTLGIAGALWSLALLWLLLALRGWAALERSAQRIANRRWLQGLLFFAAFFVVITLAGLPLDALAHHYERAYGIDIQGWAGWLGDNAKALGLTLLFGAPVLLLFNWIVKRWPRRYWLVAWVITLPIAASSLFLEPLFEPLFFRFEPLQQNHPALVAELETIVARTGTNIPPSRMYLMKASEKYNGLNAYVSGIGATKRIVVWDTTAGRIPDDEVQFIFGHESGHYVLNHIPKWFAGDAAGMFFLYWLSASFAACLVRRFGTRWGATDLASRTGFMVLLCSLSLALFLVEPAGNAFSRHFEHQADIYGQEAIHGVVPNPQKTAVGAFNHLGAAWLEDPHPSPFIVFWLFDHPSTQHRAEFAEHYDPWANGGHGEFFQH